MAQFTCVGLGGTCNGDQDWFMSQGQSIVFNPESTGTAVFTVVQEQTMEFDPRPTTTKSLNSVESSSTAQHGVTTSRGSSPTSTSALSTDHSRVSSGAIAGIAVGMCVVASCLILAVLCYLERCKRRLVSTRVDPFIDRRHLRAKPPLESPASTCASSCDIDAERSADGDRCILWIRAHAQTQPDASLVARISSSASDGAAQPPQTSRETSNGVVMAEKVLREWRNRTRTVAPPARHHEASVDEGVDVRARVETPVSLRMWSNRDSTVAVSDSAGAGPDSGASVSELESPRVEISVPSPIHFAERQRTPGYEVDGGVRLAGGRVGEVFADDLDQDSTVGGSTFPPPYLSHFGGR